MHYMKYKEIKSHGTAGFPVGYYHVSQMHPQYAMPYHWHEELELIHILEGRFDVTVNENSYHAAAGDILIVNSGFLHGGVPHDCVYECLVFPCGLLLGRSFRSPFLEKLNMQDLILDEYYPKHGDCLKHTDYLDNTNCLDNIDCPNDADYLDNTEYPLNTESRIRAMIIELFQLIGSSPLVRAGTGESGHGLIAVGLLNQIMGYICSSRHYADSCKTDISTHKNIYLLKNVLNYIEQNYPSKIQLNTLARIAGMSPKYFCRFFWEMTSKTPIDYVNYYRVERACYLLVNTDISITELSLSCGFNDVSYFIKTFKKYKGKSPRQYLKEPCDGNRPGPKQMHLS